MHTIDRNAALEAHRKAHGKIRIYPTMNVQNEHDIGMAYVLGGAIAAKEIEKDRLMSYELTGRANRIALISNGSAVLGLGRIGADAALPVMEGKCLLFKIFGDVNAIPLCINTESAEDIVRFSEMVAPTFGAINIEDVSSPDTFLVVRELQKRLNIPVFSDDQHGSAVVVLSALMNALEVVGKKLPDVRIVVFGAGASGVTVSEILIEAGARNIVVVNSSGILCPENRSMNAIQRELAERTNPERLSGSIDVALRGADVLIGLSSGGRLEKKQLAAMNSGSVFFALSMPQAEMSEEEALQSGITVYAAGLTGSLNPMPNLHVYPGLARGLLDVRSRGINNQILLAASRALAEIVDRRRLSERHIMPDLFSDEVAPRVAEAVAQAAIQQGMAEHPLPPKKVYDETWQRLYGGMLDLV